MFVPVGGLIYFYSFRSKNLLIGVINTFFSVPTVFVGLIIFAGALAWRYRQCLVFGWP